MKRFSDGRALAILNPAAGRGRVHRKLRELAKLLRASGRVDIAHTAAPGDGARLAREAAEEGYDRVIAVGGDGTVHDVVNGVLGSELRLAIVPLGSANDLAHVLGIRDWRGAARGALTGPCRPIDVALANGRAVANALGVGADTAGASAVERHRPYLGPLAYLTAAIATAATYRPDPVRVTFDGEVIEGRYLLVVVANSGRFGNGMRVAPRAELDDGMLDLCLVAETTRLENFQLLPLVYFGAHVGHPKVRIERVREVLIEKAARGAVQYDGELSEAERIEVSCVPSSLWVVTPS